MHGKPAIICLNISSTMTSLKYYAHQSAPAPPPHKKTITYFKK
jgi:hypothetical protein